MAFGIAAAMNLFMYYASSSMALRMYRAKVVTPAEAPELYTLVDRPLALAGALRKLDAAAHQIPMQVSPAVAPLAMVNPLAALGGGVTRLFSTHPPTEARVARLEAIALGR